MIIVAETAATVPPAATIVKPLYQAFIDAGEEAGYGLTEDYNGYRQRLRSDAYDREGWRSLLDPKIFILSLFSRSNLTVMTEFAEVDRIELEDGAAKRVVFKKAGA